MQKEQVIAKLKAHEAELRHRGIQHLYLFGSVARDEDNEGSDVDLFFDYDDPRFSLVELLLVQQHLSDMLQRPADVMTRGSLHPALRHDIERSALQVF